MYQFIIQTMIDSILDSTCLYYVMGQENLTQKVLLHRNKIESLLC